MGTTDLAEEADKAERKAWSTHSTWKANHGAVRAPQDEIVELYNSFGRLSSLISRRYRSAFTR